MERLVVATEKMETSQGKMTKLYVHRERMMARMDFQLEKKEAMVNVFEERSNKMDVTDLEASREKLEAVAEQQDALKEEVAEDIIGALENRYGDQHSVVECLRQPKKRTQSNGVS
jgi:hypothetical protein